MPAMKGRLDTLEVAFDYKTSLVGANYASLEVGYMKDPFKASSFVSIKTLSQVLEYKHEVVTLESVPADAQFIAFRYAGASSTSTYCTASMDNFVVAAIGKSGDVDMSEEDLPDPSIWSLSYSDAGYTWYYLGDEQYFGMLLISDDLQDTIAAVFTSEGDCTQFASQDGVEFPQDDPNAEYRYYFNTRYILNVDDAGLMKFGAFVELLPGKEGLCHISQLAKRRVENVEDVVQVGDQLEVKVVEIDDEGRVNVSHKVLL
jgi:hypothetical protein